LHVLLLVIVIPFVVIGRAANEPLARIGWGTAPSRKMIGSWV